MSSNYITGIDIGNASVKTVIAEMSPDTDAPRIVGVGNALSNGLRRGMVVDMEEAIQSVRDSVQQAELMSGSKIRQAHVSINGLHIKTQTSRGVIAVSRADNEIAQSDISRLIEAASTVSLPSNYEIIHVIPRTFIIDGTERVKNPLGMKGVRLEVEVLLVEGLSPYIRNLAKCVTSNGIEVADFVFSPLAAAKAALDKHQREYGVALVDIGGGVSTLAIFHEGEVVHTAVLPIGARHITNDLAIAFRTSLDKAESIKKNHGSVGAVESVAKKDLVDLSAILEDEEAIVPRRQIIKIIDARMNELFDMISTELKRPASNLMLPSGLVLTGGGANITGLAAFAKNRLGLAVKIGTGSSYEGISEQLDNPAYAVAIGLVLWGAEHGAVPPRNPLIPQKFIKWLKSFIP